MMFVKESEILLLLEKSDAEEKKESKSQEFSKNSLLRGLELEQISVNES
jgi:predicted metal-binding protein